MGASRCPFAYAMLGAIPVICSACIPNCTKDYAGIQNCIMDVVVEENRSINNSYYKLSSSTRLWAVSEEKTGVEWSLGSTTIKTTEKDQTAL